MHARSLGPLVKTRPFGMTPSQKDRKLHRYDGAATLYKRTRIA
ncbi:MAG TPA: hypothetical protein VN950_15235 [Terriglobales bacterium]|jgi:hypothetical protein|nr:hypothetical protein [Terriglobales bacterium]